MSAGEDVVTDAEKIRSYGLFDLHSSLPGLLKDLAAFLEQHELPSPMDLTTSFDDQRGWTATFRLQPRDFLRVFASYPVPPTIERDGDQLHIEVALRAGRARCSFALDRAAASLTPEGLLLRW